jgi:hypothetical protein
VSGQGAGEGAGLSRQDKPEASVTTVPETSGATPGNSEVPQGGDVSEQVAPETGVDTEKTEE